MNTLIYDDGKTMEFTFSDGASPRLTLPKDSIHCPYKISKIKVYPTASRTKFLYTMHRIRYDVNYGIYHIEKLQFYYKANVDQQEKLNKAESNQKALKQLYIEIAMFPLKKLEVYNTVQIPIFARDRNKGWIKIDSKRDLFFKESLWDSADELTHKLHNSTYKTSAYIDRIDKTLRIAKLPNRSQIPNVCLGSIYVLGDITQYEKISEFEFVTFCNLFNNKNKLNDTLLIHKYLNDYRDWFIKNIYFKYSKIITEGIIFERNSPIPDEMVLTEEFDFWLRDFKNNVIKVTKGIKQCVNSYCLINTP